MANPIPDPAYLGVCEPTVPVGYALACMDAQILRAINNAGITLDMSNPYNQPVQPTMPQGYALACIAAKLSALADNI